MTRHRIDTYSGRVSTVAYQVDIEAPAEHVWSFLDDESRLLAWMPEIIDTVPVTAPDRAGAGGQPEAGQLENAAQVSGRGEVEVEGQAEAAGSVGEACGDRVGARFRQTVRIGRHLRQFDGEVVLHHAPWLLGLRFTDESIAVTLTFDIYPVGTGTRLDYRVDIAPRRWTALLHGLFARPRAARIMSRQLVTLKCLAEDTFVDEDMIWPVPVYVPPASETEDYQPPIAAE